MRHYVDDVKRLAHVLGSSLDSTVIHEEFGQVDVRLEARDVSDTQLESLQKLAFEMNSHKLNGASPRVSFDAVSRRIFYSLPERAEDGTAIEMKSFRDALKAGGVKVLNGR